MNREELAELAALYALGTLEGDDLRRFEQELRSNPAAVTALQEQEDNADLLAFLADPTPPTASLEEKIFSSLPEQRPSNTNVRAKTPEPSAPTIAFNWLPWGIAAALAITCATFWVDRSAKLELIAEKDARIQNLEQESVLDNLRIAVLRSQLATAPLAQAVAVWDGERQEGKLSVADLPAVGPDQSYQLWIVDPAYEVPVDGGVFNTDETGSSSYTFSGNLPVSEINAFALSLEKAGGVPVREGPIVLVSK